ncbi:MAG: DUF502 domain-containing protein [Mariniphaga sp.]
MKKLVTYFIQGLLLVAPLGLTGYIVYRIFMFTDGLLSAYLIERFNVKTPGLGILIIFVFLVLLGMVGETILARPIKKIINRILTKTPFLKLIYSSINDLISAFIGKERKFHRPVLILINKENNLWKIGFITQDTPLNIEGNEIITVYCPFSYGFSGEIYFVPETSIKPLSIPPSEAMKFIVSGGVSGGNFNSKNAKPIH